MNKNDLYILSLLSDYLNNNPKEINTNIIHKMVKEGLPIELAYRSLLIQILNIEDYNLKNYFGDNLSLLDLKEYQNDLYYKTIHFPNKKIGKWRFSLDKYEPFELFVKDDFIALEDKVVPSLGYFDKPFYYPAVYEGNRLWMSVTPNGINTMKKPIEEAFGNVLTIGLGLGYYTFMVANKDNVKSVTVIERDKEVIELFKKYILPQIKNKDKIKIIEEDCFSYLEHFDSSIDYAFIDIWHDVLDGLPLYKRIREYEKNYPKTRFSYWIYETMKHYL